MRLWRSAGTESAEFAKKSVRIQNSVISKRQKRKSAVPTLYLYKLVLSKLGNLYHMLSQ